MLFRRRRHGAIRRRLGVKEGHYRVRIKSQWWDVPDEAAIREPNRAGRTVAWPLYGWTLGEALRIEIRCFFPGAMM
ncbi:hypothetical protein ACSHT2_18035 [Bradyrhizobium sp. PUT101]|uniref:hypothetical protein n=1 Tax=Bradyrhizobium sp. PUT101 TaxID=3447427 RepID=UPI003F86970E